MAIPAAPLRQLGMLGTLDGTARLLVEGTELRVAGWIAYDDEWVEYLLADTTWLCVEEDGGTKLSRWWDRTEPAPPFRDGAIVVAGNTYKAIETYTSAWQAAGIGDLQGPGTVTVTDFESVTDPTYLAALEDWGDGPELSIGKALRSDQVVLL
jgi:hypothetical protein